MVYENGDMYEGQWSEDLKWGHGVMSWSRWGGGAEDGGKRHEGAVKNRWGRQEGGLGFGGGQWRKLDWSPRGWADPRGGQAKGKSSHSTA